MRFVIMLLAIVATPSLVHAQGADFEVTGGASLNGFTYTQQGALQYRGRAFSPAVTANPRDVARFRISRSPSSPLAAAIAVDADGANRLYLLDTETFVSRGEILCTPQRTLLSPSQRYIVVHCSYSGDSFVSIDLQSRRVLIGNHLGWEPAVVDPNEPERAVGTKIWRLTSEPHWMGSTDVLTFSVDEYCTPGTSRSCTDQAAITATASYEVRLDAKTLQVRATARGPNRDRCAGERIRCSGARGHQVPEPMRDVGFGEFTRGGFLYDLPVSFRIPAGYVAVRSRGQSTQTFWASPADSAALAANQLPTMHDGFYSVALTPNVGYDVDTDRFIDGGRDVSTMKATFEARGFTAVSLKRHRINGYPVLIVEGEKDGRRYVVVYVASLVDTNVVYAYYEHPESMRELDRERWDAFKAAILASPPPPAR